jgi:hypothetical protein
MTLTPYTDPLFGEPARPPGRNATLRGALYMPALSAVRFDPNAKAFYDAVQKRGKKKIQAPPAPSCANTSPTFGLASNLMSLSTPIPFPALPIKKILDFQQNIYAGWRWVQFVLMFLACRLAGGGLLCPDLSLDIKWDSIYS